MLVKGASRACIYDLQRSDIYPVPLSLAGIFTNGICPVEEWKAKLDTNELNVFEEYVSFLLMRELAFYCSQDEIQLFPNLSEEYLFPATISNAVLDTYGSFEYFDQEILDQLTLLCCHHIQLRYFNKVAIVEVERLLALIKPGQIKSIEIIMPEDTAVPGFYESIRSLMTEYKKVSCLIISGADKTEVLADGKYGMGSMVKVNEKITQVHHCGIIDVSLFSVNIPTYTESLAHNTCLNRKISIDTEGNIKNCPSMSTHYGNIKNTTLREAIDKPGFKKYWHITKDQVTKCKDCEFRHICTDCRAYLDDPEDQYSAPLKCGYNPYTCEWEEWSTHPLKQAAMDYYLL